MVTGTVLAATEFCDLLCARYIVTSPTSRETETDAASPLMYITDLASENEAWSPHVTSKCVKKSSIFLDKPSTKHQYAPNP